MPHKLKLSMIHLQKKIRYDIASFCFYSLSELMPKFRIIYQI